MIEAKVSKFGLGQTWLMHARLFSAPLKPLADRLSENVFKKKIGIGFNVLIFVTMVRLKSLFRSFFAKKSSKSFASLDFEQLLNVGSFQKVPTH